jgi:hypothetical protein
VWVAKISFTPFLAAARASSSIHRIRPQRWSPWATFRVIGPSGERTVPAAEFFSLPRVDAKRENVLGKDEILASISLPPPRPNSRSTYHKILDHEV